MQVVQTKLVFPPFSKQMSLISIQISSGATVHLSWNIIGGYEKDCTIAELYNGIKSGFISIDFWSFPDKLSNHDVGALIKMIFIFFYNKCISHNYQNRSNVCFSLFFSLWEEVGAKIL